MLKLFKTLLVGATIAFVNGYQIDFSNMNQLSEVSYIQSFTSERIQISNSQLIVEMSPSDGDGLTGNSRYDDDRQRDEISLKTRECIAKRGETIKYKANIKMMDKFDWKVDGSNWYHLIQIKKWGSGRPMATLGIKNSKLVIYRCDTYNGDVIGDVNKYWGKWVNFNAEVVATNRRININYKVNNKVGTITCKNDIAYDEFIYLKLGQYRSYPNPINSKTKTIYSNVLCI